MNWNVYSFNFDLVSGLCEQTESAKTNLSILQVEWCREKLLLAALKEADSENVKD